MSGKENRKYNRLETVPIRLNATIAILTENRATGCVVPVKDYSKSGAGIYIKFKVELNTFVRLSLEGIDLDPVFGKVVWCTDAKGDPNAPADHLFRAGIDFVPQDDAERDNQIKVYSYVLNLVNKPQTND